MFERAYRKRLETDLARWQESGVISPVSGEAIRAELGPLPQSVHVATVVGILAGLLIAAAFLAFIASNWTQIARPGRFLILLGGIAGAYGCASVFARTGRGILADVSVTVGSIVFGAAIALVGQMYHLGEDFAGGMMLWSVGALAAAVLAGSRGALVVALVAACIWSGMRISEAEAVPHLPFLAVWIVSAALAIAWNSAVARHLVALAACVWWVLPLLSLFGPGMSVSTVMAGGALMLGGGLALALVPMPSLSALGHTVATYGAFALALSTLLVITGFRVAAAFSWVLGCNMIGVLLALVTSVLTRRAGAMVAALATALALPIVMGYPRPTMGQEPWFAYALTLAVMLCVLVSGMLDEVRPRVVAGWLGIGLVIALITWSVPGSLLHRSIFLAVVGVITVLLALLLGRLVPREGAQ